MADVCDERVTFGKLTRRHTQYGTTSSAGSARVNNADTFITHTVQVGDTLQRIAVKYGVAVSSALVRFSAVGPSLQAVPVSRLLVKK